MIENLLEADKLLFEAIKNLEQAWRKLATVRDSNEATLDSGRIDECIRLIHAASNTAKEAYWKYLYEELNFTLNKKREEERA